MTSINIAGRGGRRGLRVFISSTAVAMACALIRYVLLARILGPKQLGLAAVLILVAQFFDSISDIAADRFLITDRDGDEINLQKMVQLSLVVRGTIIAFGLAVAAYPIALFYNEPALVWPLALFGLSPFISSFIHLDMRRAQRQSDFGLEGTVTLWAEVFCLAVTILSAFILRTFVAVLFGQITRSLVMAVGSHLHATRPYNLRYEPEYLPRLAKYSWPLIINGTVLFFADQADRLLVSKLFDLAALGRFSATLLLIYYPTSMIQRNLHAIFLSSIASDNLKSGSVNPSAETLASITMISSTLIAIGFAVIAPSASALLFGARFHQPVLLFVLVGILQTSRFIRNWPCTVALALGKTHIEMQSNLVRLSGYPAAIAGAISYGLYGLIAGLIAGELLALIFEIKQTNRASGNSSLNNIDRFILFLLLSCLLVFWVFWASFGWTFRIMSVFAGASLFLRIIQREKTTLASLPRIARTVLRAP